MAVFDISGGVAGSNGQVLSFSNPPVDRLLNRTMVIEDVDVTSFLGTYLSRDILPSLLEMTGVSFAVESSSSTRGVIRVRSNTALPVQGYRITASTTSDTLIEGHGWRGCKYGLYAWLEQLGCKRLGMSPRFQITPSRSDLRLSLSLTKSPSFKSIAMGWQGAPSGLRWPYGSGSTTDSLRHLDERAKWMDWMNRPRAHYGSTDPSSLELISGLQADVGFVNANTAALAADPNSYSQFGLTYKNSHPYTISDFVTCNGNSYHCKVPGISAASGSGPSGTGSSIVDGGCTFEFWEAGARSGASHFSVHMTHEGHGAGSSTDYSGSSGVIGLYAAWIVGLKDTNDAIPVAEFTDLELSLGAAVSDGSPECKDDKCQNLLRNVYFIDQDAKGSDKELWRAGRILDIAKLTRPGNWTLTCYAYDLQSFPPTAGWPVNSSLLVMLANYGFQREDGLPATNRLERWGDRSALDGFQLGIYDFWSEPQYNRSDARFQAELAWKRIREQIDNGVVSHIAETPFSIGSVGIHWWGAFKMAWDGPRSYDSLMTEWCNAAFGAGATYMRRSLDRWWGAEWPAYSASAYEVALDFKNFKDAYDATASDTGSRSRVVAWMAYLIHLHYKRVWDILDNSSPTTLAAEALAEAYITHVWRTNKLVMIDCVWTHDVVLSSSNLSAPFKSKWHIPNDATLYPTWQAANPVAATDYTDADIVALFESLRTANYASVPTPANVTVSDLSAFSAPYANADPSTKSSAYLYGDYGRESGTELFFKVRPGATGTIVFGFSAPILNSPVQLRIKNYNTGATVVETLYQTAFTLGGDGSTYTVDLSLFPAGDYSIRFENQAAGSGWHIVSCPHNVPIALDGPTSLPLFGDATYDGWPAGGSSGTVYFHVPRLHGTPAFHFFSGGVTSFVIRKPDMSTVTPVALGRDSYRIDVPSGTDNAVWRLELSGPPSSGTTRFLDIPNRVSPTKAQMMIPTNLYNE